MKSDSWAAIWFGKTELPAAADVTVGNAVAMKGRPGKAIVAAAAAEAKRCFSFSTSPLLLLLLLEGNEHILGKDITRDLKLGLSYFSYGKPEGTTRQPEILVFSLFIP